MAEIVFSSGPLSGQTVKLSEAGILLGRSGEADVALDDGQVSGRHAELRRVDGRWTITDLDSSNGTVVNGEPARSATLKNGDSFQLGETEFLFKDDAVTAPPAGEKGRTPSTAWKQAPPKTAPEAEATREDVELVKKMSGRAQAIRDEVAKVIIGQREVLDQMLMCMLADGHALLIGLPGMAKTLMVRTIAQVLDMEFKRIQFTPDLMPADITGTEVLESNRETGEKEFRFIKGPLFCNLLLADEINRTPPKTQAALLEAMQEKHVTAGNVTYDLDMPFFVLATQNPIEQEGTYPLPEAQLDRFMFNIWVDYPERQEEERIVGTTTIGALEQPKCVLKKEEVLQLQSVVRKIPVSEHVIKYVIRLVRATRPKVEGVPEVTRTYVSTGAGPRAGQYLVLAAKARAVLEGRVHVSCKDIRRAAIPVLRHRILTNFAADSEGQTTMDIVQKLIEEIEEPGEKEYAAGG